MNVSMKVSTANTWFELRSKWFRRLAELLARLGLAKEAARLRQVKEQELIARLHGSWRSLERQPLTQLRLLQKKWSAFS